MPNDICELIEKDEFYQQFLSDKKIQTIALSYTDQISKLAEGLDILSTELQSQVREQHGALLSQASHASKLETAIETVNSHVVILQSGAEKLKSQVTLPYNLLETQTSFLERLHDASHILRQTGRFLQLYKQLQSTNDLIFQASILFEIEPFLIDQDIKKIDFIKDELASTLLIRQKLISHATIDLNDGLKNKDQKQIEKGLLIFLNLQKLNKSLDDLLEIYENDIKQSIKECFSGADIVNQKPIGSNNNNTANKNQIRGPGKLPTLTISQNFRQKLWSSVEYLFTEEIFLLCEQIILLQKCINNIHLNSNEIYQQSIDVKNKFWINLEKLLEESFKDCPPHVEQCLQQSLPKLLAAANSLQSKLDDKLAFGANTFKHFQNGYLEKCGTTLKFSIIGTDCPTQDAVDVLCRSASIELSAALVDEHLSILIAGVFSACNKDFWNKTEAYIKFGTDSQQVFDIPNAAQIQNTMLANTINYHNMLVKRMVTNLGSNFSSSSAAEKILNDLNDGEKIILKILNQLIDSMTSAVNIILLSMHREPGLNNVNLITNGPSLYMKEFQDFLQRAWTSHILPFNDTINTEKCGKELARKCITLFVQNLSSVRPLSQAGRNRLKSDCQYLEIALKPICSDLSVLGNSFRFLRAISSIITVTPESLVELTTETQQGPVPSYLILFILFGHAGNDLQSPHTSAGWSNEKLIQWLNGHSNSDRDKLELISGSLQKYRQIIQKKNEKKYDVMYPIIANYLELASKNEN